MEKLTSEKLVSRRLRTLGLALLAIVISQTISAGDDKTEFLKLFSQAERGDTTAQLHLGMRYQQGRGTAQNYKQAIHWYSKAAEKGNAVAQSNLGLMNYQARGIPQDYKKALQWFTRSAEQGNARAQRYLGIMYKNGNGVQQDSVVAHMWFIISASSGDELGVRSRDHMATTMTHAQIAEAQVLAHEWRGKHSY